MLPNTSPENPIQFLIHVILSLGKYHTGIDALSNPFFRHSFQAVNLIGNNNEDESLKQYVKDVTKLYIEEQLVFHPSSMKKAESYIVMAYGIFNDVIVHNSIPIFELPPFYMTTLRNLKTVENEKFWYSKKEYQLKAVTLQYLDNIPSLDEMMIVTRDDPLEWDLLSQFNQFQNKSKEAFDRQKSIRCMYSDN